MTWISIDSLKSMSAFFIHDIALSNSDVVVLRFMLLATYPGSLPVTWPPPFRFAGGVGFLPPTVAPSPLQPPRCCVSLAVGVSGGLGVDRRPGQTFV